MEGGPPVFPPDSSCPAVLWIQLVIFPFRIRDSHTVSLAFPCHSANSRSTYRCPNPKSISTLGLASSDFARHYFRNRGCFLFLALLRCFSSGGSPHTPMDSVYDAGALFRRIAPFGHLRIISYLLIPAAFRSLSRPSSAPSAKAFTLRSF